MSTPITYRELLIDRYQLIYDWIPEGSSRVLDIGCGNGVFTQWLRHRGDVVVGTDHNHAQLREAQSAFPELVTTVSSGTTLPFQSDSFDVVVMSDVLEHMDDDQVAVVEAFRVLKVGGLLLVSLPNRGPLTILDGDNIVNRLVWAISKLRIPKGGSGRFYEGFVYTEHRHYGLRDVRRLIGNMGEVEKTYYGGILFWPVAYLIEKCIEVFFRKPLVNTDYRLLRRLRAADFRLSIGSWSYNLVVAVRKSSHEKAQESQ